MDRIKIVENGIIVDVSEIKRILVVEWPEIYNHYYSLGARGRDLLRDVLGDIADEADGLMYKTEELAQNRFDRKGDYLDWNDSYPKSDIRSIGFKVLRLLMRLSSHPIETVTTEDIPFILEFLDTPPDKTLEAWDKWEKYWANLDYPARRKKILEDPRYN